MKVKGQVTISIEDFEKLKAAADAKEYAENKLQAYRDRMKQLYELDDTEFTNFWKCIEEIEKAISEAKEG